MPEILIIRPSGILTNEVSGPQELQVKRVSLRTSIYVPGQTTVPSCFPACPCYSLCCTGAGGEKHKESFIPSTAQEGTCWKRSVRRQRSRQ